MTELPAIAALSDKLCARDSVLVRLNQLPRPLVFTNGVFDVLHRGHVIYLTQVRAGLHQPGDLV